MFAYKKLSCVVVDLHLFIIRRWMAAPHLLMFVYPGEIYKWF